MRKSLQILIVDDDKDFREWLKELLNQELSEKIDLRFTMAHDGLDALGYLDAKPFHYIITDTNMPLMNGVELLKKCVERFPSTPICVLFSGLLNSNLDDNAVRAMGADIVVSKMEALPTIIKRLDLLEH